MSQSVAIAKTTVVVIDDVYVTKLDRALLVRRPNNLNQWTEINVDSFPV